MPAARRLSPDEPLEALEPLSDSELLRKWLQVWGAAPPRRLRRDLPLLGLAWRLQAQVDGGLRAATQRRLLKLAEKPENPATAGAPPIRLKPGARLLREWRGEAHEVGVLEQASPGAEIGVEPEVSGSSVEARELPRSPRRRLRPLKPRVTPARVPSRRS